MKRLIIISLLLPLLMGVYAQGLNFLKSETRICVEIDYTDTLFNGLALQDFSDVEPDWEKDIHSIYAKFIAAFNSKLKSPVGGKINNANYKVIVYPIIIERNGNSLAYYTVVNKDGNEVYRSKDFKSKGGRFGSFLNLIGDGMESLGSNVAKQLKAEMK